MCDIFVLEPIRDLLYNYIGCQFGYLVHCKRNIKDFADEVDKLSRTKERVQKKVNDAKDNAEIIYEDVSKWLGDVQSMEDDKSRLLRGKDNLKCLDVCSRYRLGKEGKKKKPAVTKLIADGNNFGDVGYRRRPPITFQKEYSIKYEGFQSREFIFEEIMKALRDDGTYKIGIHGMPGVGKTRMMEEVAQQAQKESLFDEVAQIVVSQNPILTDIQQKLAKSLNMQEPENASKAPICDRLRNGKRILIMVDDVWNNEIKLEDIGIPAADNRTKGCKIILTSRMKEVCLRMAEKEFEIGVLSEDEAFNLFKKAVRDFRDCGGMHSVAEEVCRECDGLPLAIVTIGAALRYEKDTNVWNDALEQLKHSMAHKIPGVSDKLYSCIQLSYKYLKLKDQRLCFLHCCLFPEDAEISIDDLAIYGVGMRFLDGTDSESMEKARQRTCTLISALKKFNLLLNGRNQNFVKMHDVIRDVAISIASKEKESMFLVKAGVRKWTDEDEYKQCKTISLRFNDDCVLPDDSECTEVCTLMLEFHELPSEIRSSFFEVMEKLKVLQLRKMQIWELPSSLKNLRMLRLYDCELVNVAFLKEFKKLEILCIKDYNLKELAPEIGQLTRLRLLDVRGLDKLKILPSGVISSLSQLEELYIPDEFDGWEVEGNASLMELNSLTHLVSLQVHVPNVELLPLKEIPFKLIRFQISIGSKLDFYDIFGSKNDFSSQATRILKLVGFPMKKELDILMEKAEVLYLEDLKENVPNGLCGSVLFRELSLLKVVNCKSMIYLFSSVAARSLSQLQELTISGCEIMEEIIRDDDREVMDEVVIFHHLKKIKLEDLPKLRSFCANTKKLTARECNTSTLVQALFNDKVAFPALGNLAIVGLKSITAIWEAQVSFQSLRVMSVWRCHKLVNVIASNVVYRCDSVEEIVTVERGQLGEEDVVHDEIIVFPQLKYLELNSLENLKSFTHGSKEEEETVDQRVEALFNHKVAFPALENMSINRCEKLVNVIASNEIIVFPQLKYLELRYLPRVETLFNHKDAFPALEDLIIIELESLTAIWNDQSHSLLVNEGEDSFRFLKCIAVERCNKLVNVIPSDVLSRLQNLEKLEVDGCGSAISEAEVLTLGKGSPAAGPTIVLPQLRVICLMNPPCSMMYVLHELNRKEYSGRNFAYPNLKELYFPKCHSLRNVFSPSTTKYLVHLQKLVVIDCEKMEGIVAVERGPLDREEGVVHDDEVIDFPQLKHLTLEQLPNLNSFYSICGSEKEEETAEQNFGRVEALFNYKVSFPALKILKIKKLQSLTLIWDNQLFLDSRAQDSFRQLRVVIVQGCEKLVNVIPPNAFPRGLTVFQSLKHLILIKCDSLRFLFSLSMARGLTLLKLLWIGGCSAMEQIVRSEGQGEEDDTEEIVFTRLNGLVLVGLPNLTCFCGTNNAFKFPSLKEVVLRKCPQLQTFTTGCLSTPDKLTIYYEGGECNDVIDLNDYVQKFVRREKGLAVDESDDEETNLDEDEDDDDEISLDLDDFDDDDFNFSDLDDDDEDDE